MESRFWLENIFELFSSPCLVPVKSDNLETQLNSLTRLILLGLLLCAIFNVSIDYRISLAAIFLLILTYYVVKSFQTFKEHYGLVESIVEPFPKVAWNTGTNDFVFSSGQDDVRNRCCQPSPTRQASITLPQYNPNPQLVDTGQSQAWCPQNLPIESTIGANQSLVGPPNPKTLVRPVIPTPIYDFEVWKPNDFIIPTGINDQRRQEMYDNGYVPIQHVQIPEQREEFTHEQHVLPPNVEAPRRVPIQQVEVEESYESPLEPGAPYGTFSPPSIDTMCGYQPSNLDYNLPINYKASSCQQTPTMKEYNRDLFTIPLQPGLYTTSQVNQVDASQSNLGISMTPSFFPTAFQNRGSYSTFVELAGEPVPKTVPFPRTQEPLRTEIYDPRLTGYGTSYRSYIEPVTGQPRFYYDDINQQTQYNYLTRNNIDFANFGTQTGPVRFGESLEGDALTNYADNTYSNSQVTFRNEMQQRLMHKNSNREWQQRIAPISTMNQRRAGGGTNSASSYSGPRGG